MAFTDLAMPYPALFPLCMVLVQSAFVLWFLCAEAASAIVVER